MLTPLLNCEIEVYKNFVYLRHYFSWYLSNIPLLDLCVICNIFFKWKKNVNLCEDIKIIMNMFILRHCILMRKNRILYFLSQKEKKVFEVFFKSVFGILDWKKIRILESKSHT